MTDHARRWSVPPVRMPSSIMRFSNLQEILSEKRSNHGCEAYRYSHGWRRRSGTEFRDQDGGIPWKRDRLRGDWNSPRLGGTDACQPSGSEKPHPLRAPAESREHAHHRSHGRHLSAQLAPQSVEDEE